jgi:hypothetical protein
MAMTQGRITKIRSSRGEAIDFAGAHLHSHSTFGVRNMKLFNSIIGLSLMLAIQLGCSKAPVKDYTVYLPNDATEVITQKIQQGIDYSIYLKANVTPEGFKVFCDNLELSKEPNEREQSEFSEESIREWWFIPPEEGEEHVRHHYYSRNILREDRPEFIRDTLTAFYYNGNLYFQHMNF